MAREILFMAKRIDNGEWVEGYLFKNFHQESPHDRFSIQYKTRNDEKKWKPKYMAVEIDESTICQYTGLTDKNGNKIWENDVVKVESDVIGSPFGCGMIGKIEYSECAFWVVPNNILETTHLFADDCAEIEVIGNIFDNPELLKEE